MTSPQRDFHDARFFLLVDGFPYFLSEEPAPIYVHVRMSGDLDSAGEFMGLKINGVTVCEGQTGFQDATLRDFGCFDVSQLLSNHRGPILLEAYASAAVGTPAGVVNTLEAHFVNPFGEPLDPALASPAQKYTFTPLQSTTTPIIQHGAPRSSSSALTKRAISLGGAKIDLETFAQIGFSLTAKARDPNGMLADLFTSRKQPFGYSTDNKTSAETNFGGLNVALTSIDAGKWYFVGAETIFAESEAGGVLSMVRGCYGSEAAAIEGTDIIGQNLYESIAGFTGRRAQLWVGYKSPSSKPSPNQEGVSSMDWPALGWESFEQVGTFRLEDAPTFEGNENFSLKFSDLSTFFANRKAMVNCRPVQSRSATIPTDPTNRWAMGIVQPEGGKLQKGSAVTWALVKSKVVEQGGTDESEITGVFAYSYAPTSVEMFLPEILGLYNWTTLPNAVSIGEVKQVFAIRGDPIRGILTILNSWDGSFTYGPYDSLFGVPEPSTFSEETFRMGAGLKFTDFDAGSFLELAGLSLPWSYILQDELEVRDLLGWLCTSARCCWFVTPSGLLTVKPFDLVTKVTEAGALVEIDQDDILRSTEDKGNATERNVACSFRVKTNYDINQKSTQTINFQDIQTLKKYPSADNVTTYEMPFMQTETSSAMKPLNTYSAMVPVSLNDLEFEIRRKMKMNERGIFACSIVVPWRHSGIELGDKIKMSNPNLFNFNSGKQTALGVFFVVGKQMDLNEGTVTLELVALYSGRAFCQAGEILSYNAGTQTITFNPTSGEWATGFTPSEHFNANMPIKVWDNSGSLFYYEIVASVSAPNSIILGGTPAATYAAGDVVTIQEYGANVNGPTIFTPPKTLGAFAVDEGLLGAADDEGSRIT